MKKILFAMLAGLLLVACIEDEPYYFVGEGVYIFVEDRLGKNLVSYDDEFVGVLFEGDGVFVEYDGESYELELNTNETRLPQPASWEGLIVTMAFLSGEFKAALMFGEFKPIDNYHGEEFTIYWGDGTSDEVTFDYFFDKRDKVVKRIWLNGNLVSDNSLEVKIIK